MTRFHGLLRACVLLFHIHFSRFDLVLTSLPFIFVSSNRRARTVMRTPTPEASESEEEEEEEEEEGKHTRKYIQVKLWSKIGLCLF